MDGLLGYRSRDESEFQSSEVDLFSEALQYKNADQPEISEKIDNQPYFMRIFNKDELANFIAYWYKVGAFERLSGYADMIREHDRRELAKMEINHE